MRKILFRSGVCLILAATLLFAAACSSPIPSEIVSSYGEVREVFPEDDRIMFPDLSPLGFDEAQVTYRIDLTSWARDRSANGYTVFGEGSLAGHPVYITFSCKDRLFECAVIDDPIVYQNKNILYRYYYLDGARSVAYGVYLNGHEYITDIIFDRGHYLYLPEYEENAADHLLEKLSDVLYSFTCSLIDSAPDSD